MSTFGLFFVRQDLYAHILAPCLVSSGCKRWAGFSFSYTGTQILIAAPASSNIDDNTRSRLVPNGAGQGRRASQCCLSKNQQVLVKEEAIRANDTAIAAKDDAIAQKNLDIKKKLKMTISGGKTKTTTECEKEH
ncbi:hypothetical protein EDD11_004701 [Mortierella claussenii]|nr:hypothetical protein EDD11_004701 [Mortierella claussenii]